MCVLRKLCLLDLKCEWLIDLKKILKDNMASFKNNLDPVKENCKRFYNATKIRKNDDMHEHPF